MRRQGGLDSHELNRLLGDGPRVRDLLILLFKVFESYLKMALKVRLALI